MEIRFIENEPTKLKFEIIGEGHTLCNALRNELWNDKAVKAAGYSISHALTPKPLFVVSGSDAKKSLSEAIKRLKKTNKELRDKLKKVK